MNESGRFMLDIQCYFISTQQWYHYTFHMKWLHIIKKVHIYHLLAQLRPNNNTFQSFFRRYDIIIWMIFNSVHIVRVWLNRMFHSMLYLSTLHTIYTTTVYLSTQFGWYLLTSLLSPGTASWPSLWRSGSWGSPRCSTPGTWRRASSWTAAASSPTSASSTTPSTGTSAANRLIGEVVQSRRRPLLGPSPSWKRLLALSHLRHY